MPASPGEAGIDVFVCRYRSRVRRACSVSAAAKSITLWVLPTEGFAVSFHNENSPQERIPGPDASSIPELEADQTIAPRPEEEIADVMRAEPDVEDHSQHPE